MTSTTAGDPSSPATGGDPATAETGTPAAPPAQPPATPPGAVTTTPPPSTSGVTTPSATPPPAPTPTQTTETPEPQTTSTPQPGPDEEPSMDGSGGEGEPDVDDNGGAAGAGGAGGETSMEEPDDMSMGGGMSEPEMGGDDTCMVGSTAGNEVVIIGESFIAASSIPEELAALARANGSLMQNESYIDNSVSGTRLGDGAIPRQYTSAAASNQIRFVLMNGGGNDCLQANDPNAPIPAAEALYEEMAADGVEKVVYFFYPDAGGNFGSLQSCLDEYRPKIKALCDGLTAPKCYWLDLAETEWDGNEDAFTTDGIHPNAEGSRVTAEAIWDVMVENCVAQ